MRNLSFAYLLPFPPPLSRIHLWLPPYLLLPSDILPPPSPSFSFLLVFFIFLPLLTFPSLFPAMESLEQVIQDPYLLSLIIGHIDDHFDILNLSLSSKILRHSVLSNVQQITCRRFDKLQEMPLVFPSLTELDLSDFFNKLSDSDFAILFSELANLRIFKASLPLVTDSEIDLTPLASMSQLKVLNLNACYLDDQIAKQIGEGCKLLEDLSLTCVKGPITNIGLNDLLLSSTCGIRRLSFGYQQCPQDDPMLVIIKCSTLTCLDLRITYQSKVLLVPDLGFPKSIFKLNSIREFRLSIVDDYLNHDKFAEAIIKAGSPLEIVKLDVRVTEDCLRTICDCTTLQSLDLVKNIYRLEDSIIEELLSKNHAIVSLHLRGELPRAPKAIVERILSFEETKGKCDQNIENMLDFFLGIPHGNCFIEFQFYFGLKEGFASRLKFLQEITLAIFCVANQEASYDEELYDLLSICTLLRKVDISGSPIVKCRAFEALIGCPHLEYLSAPIINKTLRHLLSAVKGLRTLKIMYAPEDSSDETFLLLKENSPLLRELELNPWGEELDGVTDTGLGDLSFCSQLQYLSMCGNIEGSGLVHIRNRCSWLNKLSIRTYERNIKQVGRVLKKLGFENAGCRAHVGVKESW